MSSKSTTKLSIELLSQTKSKNETLASYIRRRIRLCGYCDYYPASEYGGWCCLHCVRPHLEWQAKKERERQEQEAQEARDIVEREQRKQEFDQMVANSARKPGISFADVLKNKK